MVALGYIIAFRNQLTMGIDVDNFVSKSAGWQACGERSPQADWRRERNWDPTFSKFVGWEIAQGQEQDSNCAAGIPREIGTERRAAFAG
jgi:hypothetical protein